MSFFPNSQNPVFYQCSFSDTSHSQASSALQALFNATSFGAAYNSEERYPPPKCLPRTRVEIQQRIGEWADGGKSRILWLHGPAGAGKSAVAQSICEAWAKTGQLLASFFFSRSSSTRNSIQRFIPTIACQAIQLLTGQLNILLQEVEHNPALLTMEASRQLEKFIIEPLTNVSSPTKDKDDSRKSLFIVVDGLDECENTANQRRILDMINTLVNSPCLWHLDIRVLIASRPEIHIRYAFDEFLASVSSTESLHGDLRDVHTYLSQMFQEMCASEKHREILQYIKKPWPGPDAIQTLAERSGGYFIYAATVVRHVVEEGYVCVDRLDEILCPGSRQIGSSPYMEMDKVYSQVLSSTRNMPLLKRILGCMVVTRQKLIGFDELGPAVTMTGIVNILLNLRPGELATTIRGLHSIIQLLADDQDDLRFYHASFSDYLLDERRSRHYYLDYEAAIKDIYKASLNLMYFNGPPTFFAPTTEWAVAMMSWSRLAKPAGWLLDHIKSTNLDLTFRPFIGGSRSWLSDKKYRLLNGIIRAMAVVQNASNNFTHHQREDLPWLCHFALSHYFSLEDLWPRVDLRELKKRRDYLRQLPVEQQLEDIYSWFELNSLGARHGVYTFLEFLNWNEDSVRRARFGSDDNIIICLEENSPYKIVDTRSTFSIVLKRFLDNLEQMRHLVWTLLRSPPLFDDKPWFGGQVSPKDAHLRPSLPFDPEGAVYRSGFGLRTCKGGVYGSEFIVRCNGTLHCTTYWKPKDETMKQTSKSASCVIPLHDPPLAPPSLETQCTTAKLWRFGLFSNYLPRSMASNAIFERRFWEEADRRRRWIDKMYFEWLEKQVESGNLQGNHPLSNHHYVHKEWQKIHNWLRETLEITDSEGLEAWKKGEAGRQQQLLDLYEQQLREQRKEDLSWEKEKLRISMAVDQRQLHLSLDHSISVQATQQTGSSDVDLAMWREAGRRLAARKLFVDPESTRTGKPNLMIILQYILQLVLHICGRARPQG